MPSGGQHFSQAGADRFDGDAEFWAHTAEGRDPQPLEEHLQNVARLAEQFASAFGAGPWGRLAGLWHDLGKYLPDFQRKLRGESTGVDHSTVGARLAQSKTRATDWLPLALAIAGHHGGLPNLQRSEGPARPLLERLKGGRTPFPAQGFLAPPEILGQALPGLPAFLWADARGSALESRRRLELWVRFLFSVLVDADFLDTEDFHKPGERERIVGGYASLTELRHRLERFINSLTANAPSSAVNDLRAEVLATCRSAALSAPGTFSLTVPTGGGKTLAAMDFALRHAETHGLRRVIVVIPFTSIIEQNADQYRRALGDSNVIEHHSNLDPQEESERNRLASENWDAPVIVTTSVQFFESLFARRPSRCRKLHNVARSVVLFDEVQSLPTGYLDPILEALKELVAYYGCTLVLATATQPALRQRQALPQGFPHVEEIVPDPDALARKLRRTRILWPDVEEPALSWDQLASELAGYEQVLAVVHRRADARELAELLPPEGRFHLSALMCPRHRSEILARVRRELEQGKPCRLISTQLIEAGVDIDFPVVYRALGGLDSVVQAAGRCNREGRSDAAEVRVFRAPTPAPAGVPRKALETTEAMLREAEGQVDVACPKTFAQYFRQLYLKLDKDARGIQRERQELNFVATAAKFQVIEEGGGEPVVVPYGDAARWVARCRCQPSRESFRALQPFVVNVYPQELAALESGGAFDEPVGGARVLHRSFAHLYTELYGLQVGQSPNANPSELMA